MAELLIAASEECKCVNQEKLMDNGEGDNRTQDLADSPGDAPLSPQSKCVVCTVCVSVVELVFVVRNFLSIISLHFTSILRVMLGPCHLS